ncbi:MAG: response regulator [Xanthomonadales bacterium]|nr:response regulator [Xanthomonadales bacterium]
MTTSDPGPRVLVVEDEPKIAAILRDYLQAEGYAVRLLESGVGAAETALEWPANLLILDLQLPGMDGLHVCRALRARSALPVLMLTARIEEADRLRGFDCGADDYVCKPFSPREVVARTRALLRRHGDGNAAQLPGLRLDAAHHQAHLHGQSLPLTPVEFRLLDTLARRPGTVLSRERLIDAAYPDYRVVSGRTIDSHLKNLRRKLQSAAPGAENAIEAVYGLGYRFRPNAFET